MTVQKVAFAKTARINKPYKKQNIKNHKQKNNIKSKEGSLKKALFAMGILAAAGIGVGTLIYKRNTKNIENLAQETTEKAASTINESKLGQKAEEVIDNLSGSENTAQKVNKLLLDVADDPKISQKTAEAVEDLSGESSVTQKANKALSDMFDGSKKIENGLKIKVIDIPDNAAKIQKKAGETDSSEKAREKFINNVRRATEEYKERLLYDLKLSDRIQIIKNNMPSEKGGFSISRMKRFQLSMLSNEQINALNDGTLYRLLNKQGKNSKKLHNMKFFKSLSPAKLIKIQESEEGLEKFYKIVENKKDGYEFDCLTHFLKEL